MKLLLKQDKGNQSSNKEDRKRKKVNIPNNKLTGLQIARRSILPQHHHFCVISPNKDIADARREQSGNKANQRSNTANQIYVETLNFLTRLSARYSRLIAEPVAKLAGVHCAGHYMDDYYVILPDVEELKKLGHEIVRRFEAAGICVNKKKCKIIPLTKPFRFCKAKFTLTETGKKSR